MAYQIWLFDQADQKIAYLQNAFDISRIVRVNEAPTLFFTLPADDAKAVYLTSAYQVKVWNTLKNRFEGLYDIDDATERWNSSGQFIDVNCSGVMAQLVKEDNVTYDSGITPLTPTAIMTALLALQQRTPAITIGTIEPTTPFCLSVENINLLKAVLLCATDYLGGYIEIDSDRRLNWYNEPSGNAVREIRYKKNMKGVTRKRDYTQIVNRLYAYGVGESTAQLTLGNAMEFRFNQGGPGGIGPEIGETLTIHGTSVHCVVSSILVTYGSWAEGNASGTIIATPPDAGWGGEWTTGFFDASVAGASIANTTAITKPNGYPNTVEYIEDTASQTLYGISKKRITDKRIIHPSTLMRWAQQVLAQYKDPIYYYTVDVVNLAVHRDFSFDLEELEIGQIVRVVNSDLNNLCVNVKIVSVTTNLSEPMEITLELANVTRDLADLVSSVQSFASLAQNVAVQIGAGQVVVQGTFTVDGWRSSGKTTIDGGKITASSITASQVNFAVADSSNIVATINASTEGITISANKIAINGNCVFAAGYDPSGKLATGAAAADVNSGTTTINGGKITANSITVNQLNFTPVSSSDVIATINASAEGITIAASKITISGSCSFASGYDPASKTAKVGGTYDSAASGARVRIFPDANTGILITDGTNDVFKALVGGTDVGDVIIGDYANGKGIKWDKSAGTFLIAGILETTSIKSASTLTVNGTIQSSNYSAGTTGFRLSNLGDIDARDVTIYGQIATVGNIHSVGIIDGNVLSALYSHKLTSTLSDGSAANGSIYTTNGLNLHWKDQAGNIHFFTFS